MHKLYELKEHLMKELENFADMNGLDKAGLDTIDKLAHSIKNICKVIKFADEQSYEGESYNSYRGEGSGRSMRGSYRSYRRGRDAMGRYTSRAADMADSLRDLLADAPDEQTRSEIQRLIDRVENM